MRRCDWASNVKEHYQKYHDEEWGLAVHDDRQHFELLCLECAQAGLSWETILNKRENYRRVFHNFDPSKIAIMTDNDLEEILLNPGIVRNRLKIFSVRKNAVAFVKLQHEFGSFNKYIWAYVENRQIINHYPQGSQIFSKSEISDKITKDLKKRGFTFVGSTIIYSYMQAAGLVDDHMAHCFKKTRT